MIKKIAYTLFLTWPTALLTNEPKDWQLGFQKSASKVWMILFGFTTTCLYQ